MLTLQLSDKKSLAKENNLLKSELSLKYIYVCTNINWTLCRIHLNTYINYEPKAESKLSNLDGDLL